MVNFSIYYGIIIFILCIISIICIISVSSFFNEDTVEVIDVKYQQLVPSPNLNYLCIMGNDGNETPSIDGITLVDTNNNVVFATKTYHIQSGQQYINHLKKEPVIAKFSDFILIFEPCVIKDITITGNVGGCTLYFGGGMSTTTTKVYEKYYKLNNNVIQKIIVN